MADIVDGVVKSTPVLSGFSPTVAAIVVTVIPGVLYTLAAYAHLYLPQVTILIAIVISVIFAALEYIVRVPIIKYSSEVAKLSNGELQMIWVGITLGLAFLTDAIFPRDEKKT
jgi:uncharacterized protein (DUF486 family)